MRKNYFFLAALCCAVMSLVPQRADASIQINGIYYFDYSDGWTITYAEKNSTQIGAASGNYADLNGEVTIPSSIPKKYWPSGVKKGEVTSISNNAFQHMSGKAVYMTLPTTLQKINEYAFEDAKSLRTIKLNEGLKSLGEQAFMGCSNLTSVNIPTTLTEIPVAAFYNCTSLPSIVMANVIVIGNGAFKGCSSLASVNGGNVVCPVKTIGARAFAECTNLQTINFASNKLIAIDDNAFYNCTKLEKITLPSSLVTIGEFAFENSGLKTVTNNSTTPQVIKANVFRGVNLSQCVLYVPKGCKAAYKAANVWKNFGQILEPGETPVDPIITGTYKIGNLYYQLQEDLTAVVQKNDENKNIGGSLTIPSSVTYGKYTYTVFAIRIGAFQNCTKLTSVTLPNTITVVSQQAFDGCSGLKSVTLPSSLSAIGEQAFYGTALTSISLPATLEEIGMQAFQNCTSLTSISIPAGVSAIPSYCFYKCTALSSVKLQEGLTEIGGFAFAGCTALKTLTFPASVTTLKEKVFDECTNIASFRLLGEEPPTAEYSDFYDVNKSTCILYVPAGCKSVYESAKGWDVFTNIQEKGVNKTILYGKLYYKLHEDGTAYVTYESKDADNYKDLSGEITVESKVTYQGLDYTVNEVGIDAFNGCKGITKVNLPTILDDISARAFKGCTNLAEINIPSTLRLLINNAFEDTKLFNDNKDKDGAVYYDGCLLYYPIKSKSGAYSVKDGTRLIATDVFEFDDKITELILPEGLQCLCNGSVTTMYALKTLHLPSSLYHIGGDFCNDCFYLTTIYNYREDPVDLSDNYCFDNVNASKCTLYVPKGCKSDYSAAAEWKDFPIMEMKGIYTVTFEDYDGFILKQESVAEGAAAHAPATPNRTGYSFTGWDKAFNNITSELTVTAQYEKKTFKVQFYDMDKTTLLKTDNVKYGESATAPFAPHYTGWTFSEWDKPFDVVTENLLVYPIYVKTKYDVTFFNYDNSVISTCQVEHGDQIGEANVPNASTFHQYCHSFVNWFAHDGSKIMTPEEVAQVEVTSSFTAFTAQYELDYYAVKFNVSHGTGKILEDGIDMSHVACGTVLHIEPIPDEGYEFDGWVFEYDPEAGITITEDFWFSGNCKVKKYTVTFVDWDGKELYSEEVEYDQPSTTPDDPTREGYTFLGWDATPDHVKSDMTITAQYEINTYTVTFVAENGAISVLPEETDLTAVPHGATLTLTATPDEGYAFTEWTNYDPEKGLIVTSDTTVTATFALKKYTVTFVDYDEKVLKTEEVEHGSAATAPEDPEREGYTFTGWDPADFSHITSDLTVTAQYTEKAPTGINEAKSQEPTSNSQKVLRDGSLYILVGGKTYDATGKIVK